LRISEKIRNFTLFFERLKNKTKSREYRVSRENGLKVEYGVCPSTIAYRKSVMVAGGVKQDKINLSP
jgi:hypothetical protein